jgi:hypothetical protein
VSSNLIHLRFCSTSILNKSWQQEAWKCLSKLDLHGDAAPAHAESFVSSLLMKPKLEHLSDLCFSLHLPLDSIRQLLRHCTPTLATLTIVLENATIDTIVPALFEDDVLGSVIEHVTRFEILGGMPPLFLFLLHRLFRAFCFPVL